MDPEYLIPNNYSPPNYKDNALYRSNDNGYHISLNKLELPRRSITKDVSYYDRVRYFPNSRQPSGETEIVALIEMPQHKGTYSSTMEDDVFPPSPYRMKTLQSHLQGRSSTGNVYGQREPFIFQMELESNRPRYTPPPSRQIPNVTKSHY